MVNILIGCSGSVATIKLPILVQSLISDLEATDSGVQVC